MVEPAKDSVTPPAPVAEKRWIDTIATVSSALIAIGTLLNWFFGRHTTFPPWFFYFLTILILVIVYKYFEESIRRFIQSISVRQFIRQQHFQLLDFIRRFGELVTTRSEDSISTLLQKISDRNGQEIVDRDLFGYADLFIANILLKLSESGQHITVGEFKSVLNDLSSLIKFCSYFYFKKPLHVKGITGLTAEEKKNVEMARENFADFVRRYQTFYDEVNVKLGSSSRVHFEIPKPISN
jgi:hypothetical protein